MHEHGNVFHFRRSRQHWFNHLLVSASALNDWIPGGHQSSHVPTSIQVTSRDPACSRLSAIRHSSKWFACGQKVSLQFLSTSSPNIDRFTKFFHWYILWKHAITLLLNIQPDLNCVATRYNQKYYKQLRTTALVWLKIIKTILTHMCEIEIRKNQYNVIKT